MKKDEFEEGDDVSIFEGRKKKHKEEEDKSKLESTLRPYSVSHKKRRLLLS